MAYGLSKQSYRGICKKYIGTGQGNMLLGIVNRDKSCMIFKNIENKKLGIESELPITKQQCSRNVVRFVDDTSFFTYNDTVQQNM